MSVTVWQASSPPQLPEETYLGIAATGYHLLGLYGGAVLVGLLAFGSAGRFGERVTTAGAEPAGR